MEDDTGFWRRCLSCGRDEPEGIKQQPKEQKPYEVMEQQRLEGFNCGVAEECLICPLQSCENIWIKQLVERENQRLIAGRVPPDHRLAPTLKLTAANRRLLQNVRWQAEDQDLIAALM